MTSPDKIEEIKQNHEILKIQFIKTELEMAVTFCGVAKSTDKETTARRNLDNAKRAYDSATKSLQNARLNETESREIDGQLEKAKSLIDDLERISRQPFELWRRHR